MNTTESRKEKSVREVAGGPLGELKEKTIEEPIQDLKEKTIERSTRKATKKHNKIILGIICIFSILLVIYFGLTVYFVNHFYFRSEINSIDVSGKTVEEAETAVKSSLQNYTLTLKERGGKNEQINASDAGLKINSDEDFSKLKSEQNPFKWVIALVSIKDTKMTVGLSYDKTLLSGQVDKLSCFKSDNIEEPKNASFKYEGNNYVIVKEVKGNKVNKDALYSNAVNSMLKGETEINLEAMNCYINPEYNSKSQKTIEDKDMLNKYVASKITYNSRGKTETLDGSTINMWLNVDNNMQITFDQKKVKDYVGTLSKTYDTVGTARSFATSSGNTISVSGGDYGWSVNVNKETQNLINNIKDGKAITKEPAYSQTAVASGNNDIGNTYIEINLEKQHLWFYKNGSLVVDGDVVSGNVSLGHATPAGVYYVKYKERNAILKGQDYASPVSFWMPFNGGIGVHDATWRSTFGGDIYLTNGSHGCVNAPYTLANTIFDNIDAGTPVVCY